MSRAKTPRLSKRAIAILRKVQAAIVAEPALYEQDDPWPPQRNCQTPGCICGWIDHFLGIQHHVHSFSMHDGPGVSLLGGEETYDRLFDLDAWPLRYRVGFNDLSVPGKARRASRRIDHFIATGGAE